MFKRILLAADGSDHSIRAAKKARDLAKKYGAVIDVAYVIDGEHAKADVLHHNDPFEIEKARKLRIERVREQFGLESFDEKLHILHGDPGSTIVEFVHNGSYDCVVLGSRGLNKLQKFLLGSVSSKVAKQVKCSVLIVK